ncbi:gastrula zinc finger protein XlCGF8.2DB-like [Mercenaria mercenaria]|uniref:gastrula zinc finger protein XlCGF8.2DB-like n=1 Tax=Mercenaria mercenaria TaxID=6596 RepID=UPI00234F55A2|nr:gastrula zinc finger protein XlCGF8.2DB-like [Mercenaria mercenaria]
MEDSFHELDGTHLCSRCGKHFCSRRTLSVHIKIHEGNQPFVCSAGSCGKRYNKKQDLDAHMRARHGAKKLSCSKCGKEFCSKASHVKHTKECGNPKPKQHMCKRCGAKFNRKCDLEYHSKGLHDEECKYKFDVCGQSYRWRSSLINIRKNVLRWF